MTNQDILKRLAYIKYLYKSGVEQSKQPEAVSYTSILSFHDSIDWFMHLACIKEGLSEKQKYDIITANNPNRQNKSKQINYYLMDYFTLIPNLTQSASVEKVNNIRNHLKHTFQIPAQVEIEECKNISTLFFEENTKTIFGYSFDEISIIDLINYEVVRDLLKDATLYQSKGETEECLNEVSKAFYELNHVDIDFIRGKKQFSYIDIYNIPHLQIPNLEDKPELQALKLNIDGVIHAYNNNFHKINESMKVFVLGIDYRKYLKLISFMPTTSMKDKEGNYSVTKVMSLESITKEDLGFAIDFVIDCAFKIQKFRLS